MTRYGLSWKHTAWLVVMGATLTGCQTTSPRYQLAVSNVTDQPVSNVILSVGSTTPHTTPALGPHSEVYYKPTRTLASRDAALTWKGPDGKVLSQTATVTGKFGKNFRGRIYFQISKSNDVQVFVVKDPFAKAPVMPWGKPESWEGTVGIPGLTGGEEL